MNRPRLKTQYPGITYRDTDQGRIYIIAFTDGLGTSRTKHLPAGTTLSQARTAQGTLKTRRSNGDMLIPTNKTVSELCEEWLEARKDSLAPSTVEIYQWAIQTHINASLGRIKIVHLSASDVARFIAEKKKAGLKTWSIKKILTPLRAAFRVAVRDGLVPSNPVDKLLPDEKPKGDQREMRCLSREEIQKLLGATMGQDNREENLRWKALFGLLIFTGLRISEALALTWEEIGEAEVRVLKSKTPAGIRSVILTDDMRRLLSAWRLKQAPGASYVFSTSENRPCSRRSALTALNATEDRAGLPRYTLHELRHTFASILIAQGEHVVFVSRQMGHADPKVTLEKYAHLWEGQESAEAARGRLQSAMGGLL